VVLECLQMVVFTVGFVGTKSPDPKVAVRDSHM